MKITKNDVLSDNYSGSNEVATKALAYLNEYVTNNSFKSVQELVNRVNLEGKEIIKSHPHLISVRKRLTSAIYYIKRIVKSGKSMDEIIKLSTTKINEIDEIARKKQKQISALGSKLIFNGHKILTISSSSTIYDIFCAAHKMKRKFEVFVMESRPKLEGHRFAEFLAKKGISTTIITDAAMGRFIPEMNQFLLGADRLMEDSFINKIGSLPAAIVANSFKVPVYLAAETEKILPEAERSVRFYPQDGIELYESKSKKIAVENYYFEAIPYSYISKIVCEEGIYETSEFLNWYLKD